MNILNYLLSFVFLLEFNAAIGTDMDCNAYSANLIDTMLADLVKYEAKIKHLEDTIKNLEKQQSAAPPSCVPFGDDIQTIRVPGADAFQVPCDSKLAGNGWIVIQRRIDGSVNFNQTWDEYQHGFGELRGNLWLGLERLHLLTKHQPHELYIQLQDFKNETRYARYSNFLIGNAEQNYKLLALGNYSGNANNSLDFGFGALHKNMMFSTPDKDNDISSIMNCAARWASGWWFSDCYRCNLNGVYVNTNTDEFHLRSIEWRGWHKKPLKFVQMMIRPKIIEKTLKVQSIKIVK